MLTLSTSFWAAHACLPPLRAPSSRKFANPQSVAPAPDQIDLIGGVLQRFSNAGRCHEYYFALRFYVRQEL